MECLLCSIVMKSRNLIGLECVPRPVEHVKGEEAYNMDESQPIKKVSYITDDENADEEYDSDTDIEDTEEQGW